MKFNIFFKTLVYLSILSYLISTISAAKIHKKWVRPIANRDTSKDSSWKLCVLGDIGEFDIYKQNSREEKLILQELIVPKGEDFEKICDTFTNNHKDKMMNNFQRVLNKIEDHDEICILGDMVYTESKNWGEAQKFIRSVPGLKLLTQRDIVKIDQEVPIKKVGKQKEIPDYTEVKNPLAVDDAIIKIKERENRLNCGWRYLKKLITTKAPKWVAESIEMINGNHTYDVDWKFECIFVALNFQKNMTYQISGNGMMTPVLNTKDFPFNSKNCFKPRLVFAPTPKENPIKIQYIDLDPTLLTCSDFLNEMKITTYDDLSCDTKLDIELSEKNSNCRKFMDCMSGRLFSKFPLFEFSNKDRLTFLIEYLNDVYTILENVDRTAVWRLVRMHQPIFNVEGDFTGLKLNKRLMQAFKNAHVHAFLVSHYHNAQFSISQYENFGYTYKNLSWKWNNKSICQHRPDRLSPDQLDPIKEWTSLEDINPFIKTGEDTYDFVTWPHKVVRKINRSENILRHKNLLRIYDKNEEYIVQILTGNSGRDLDPLIGDRCSDMVLVYGEAVPGEFGYTTIDFKYEDGKHSMDVSQKTVKQDGSVDGTLSTNFKIKIVQAPFLGGEKARRPAFKRLAYFNFKNDIINTQLMSRVDGKSNSCTWKKSSRRRLIR